MVFGMVAISGSAAEPDRMMAILQNPSGTNMPEMLAAMKEAGARDVTLIMVFPLACRKAQPDDLA